MRLTPPGTPLTGGMPRPAPHNTAIPGALDLCHKPVLGRKHTSRRTNKATQHRKLTIYGSCMLLARHHTKRTHTHERLKPTRKNHASTTTDNALGKFLCLSPVDFPDTLKK